MSPETEEASRQALPVQESPVPAEDSGAFFIREEDGMITVYESDRETVYLHTNIYTRLLPQRERERLAEGFFVPSEVELFDCLENYTS